MSSKFTTSSILQLNSNNLFLQWLTDHPTADDGVDIVGAGIEDVTFLLFGVLHGVHLLHRHSEGWGREMGEGIFILHGEGKKKKQH